MKMIAPVARRVEEILNAPTKYAIPRYQRDFNWGETEAQELLEDLSSYKDQPLEHLFLGNFIFESPRDQVTHVVDGQQRLTSIMLLLIACRMQARRMALAALEQVIQSKITFIDSATAQSLGCRFTPSESIKDLFEYMANETWNGEFPAKIGRKPVKRQANRIRPIYDFFSEQICGYDQQQLSQFLKAVYNTYVIEVTVANDLEALALFERTNARGLDLEVSDLLKNYLFAQRVQSIEDKWKEVLANSNGTILRMLKYFYVSRLGYVSKPQLYRSLKQYAESDEMGAEIFTSALVEFSRFFTLTKDPSKERTREYFEAIGLEGIAGHQDRYEAIAWSLQALKGFGIVQFCPVAYAAIEAARRSPEGAATTNAKALVRLFAAFEKYHFVNNVVCERVGNEVEHLYADTCISLAQTTDLVGAIQTFIASLREKRASWEEFKGRFTEIWYASDTLPTIYYIFDRFNNVDLQPGQWLQIYNSDPRALRKSNNIEHFLPQTPPAGLVVSPETKASIDNIGNLLVIYYRTNSRLGNLSPAEKAEKLNGEWRNQVQNMTYVLDFLQQYGDRAADWNADAIQERAEDLANAAYEKVWDLG